MYSSILLHGRRSVKLSFSGKHFQNRSAFHNPFSSASADVSLQDGRKGQNFTISYLVDSLGFTTKLAESIWRKVKGNPDSVPSLLRSHGFTDSQISTIITNYPRLLRLDAERSLGPKLHFLQSRGASSFELTEIVSKVPRILGMRSGKTVSRYYDLVKDIIESDKSSKHEMSCLSSPQGAQDNIIRNVLLLRQTGVPQRLLFSLLTSNCKFVSGKGRFEESLKKVVGMGFDPTTSKFVGALHALYQLSDKTIEDKISAYKRLGFDVEDVWGMFKKWPSFLIFSEKKILNSVDTFLVLGLTRDEFLMMAKGYPQCLAQSAEMVKKKSDYLVKEMNWPLKTVALYPQLLGYSMEKRIVPRCNVIKALMSKGLLGSELPPMTSVLICTEHVFLRRYVRKQVDKELVAELMDIFTRDRV